MVIYVLAAGDDELDVGDNDDTSSDAVGGCRRQWGRHVDSLETNRHQTEHVTKWQKAGYCWKLLGTGELRNTSNPAGKRHQRSPVTLPSYV